MTQVDEIGHENIVQDVEAFCDFKFSLLLVVCGS